MGTSFEEIKGFLDEKKLKYTVTPKGYITLLFGTDNYKKADGDKGILLVIDLAEDAELIKVIAPNAYKYKEGPYKLAVLEACMHAGYRSKFIQYEYDPNDGEIRLTIDLPLEDAKLTARQLYRVVSALVEILDSYDSAIRGAIETGVVNFPEMGGGVVEDPLEGLSDDDRQAVLDEIARRKAGKGAPPTKL